MCKTIININEGCHQSICEESARENLEIFVGKNAVLDYYLLENQSQTQGHSQLIIHQAEGSDVAIGFFSLQTGKTKHDILVNLEGENASIKLFGVVIADGTQEIENTTYIDHKVKSCQSNELFKYILDDEAKGAFFGRIHVEQGAIKTDAHQTVRTLCLTDKTRMQAKPELEIYADDVKCSHGATVGQLDQNALFYMRTRGIPENEAKKLLMKAFMSDVLEQIRNVKMKELSEQLVEKRLCN